MRLILGNCIEKLKELPENSVDAIVTDPPYELGFMGKSWDNTGIANSVEMWSEALRVLKPGGYLLSFGGTRTYHRMASAIEDAGFEVRDMIEFCYGSGFPKSLNVWKQLKKNCTCGNMEVYEKRIQLQQTLGEAETEYEMRLMQESNLSQTINSKKERGEVLQSGVSEQGSQIQQPKSTENVWQEQSSLEGRDNVETNSRELSGNDLCEMSERVSTDGEERRIHNATQVGDGSTLKQTADKNGSSASQRPRSEEQQYREPCTFCKQYGTQAIRTLGVGTALKPAHEPICMARKPLSEKNVAQNVLKWGTGGINIDGSRVETDMTNEPRDFKSEPASGITKGTNTNGSTYYKDKPLTRNDDWQIQGRFPANLIHDNSEEVRECFPDTKVDNRTSKPTYDKGMWGNAKSVESNALYSDSGNASRFFKSIIYTSKASKRDRGEGNNHPTVKSTALMEYLINMLTRKGATVLDPFMGSGTTGVACKRIGRDFIGIELEPEYMKIAEARIGL